MNKCKENKKTHYLNVYEKLTEFNNILKSERQFITNVNKIKLSEQEYRLVNGFDLQLNQTITIINENIKAIEEKARSRSADAELGNKTIEPEEANRKKATSRSATSIEMTEIH